MSRKPLTAVLPQVKKNSVYVTRDGRVCATRRSRCADGRSLVRVTIDRSHNNQQMKFTKTQSGTAVLQRCANQRGYYLSTAQR